MKKKYDHTPKNLPTGKISEPIASYEMETEMAPSPPLTEEELAEAISGKELVEAVCNHIHELFNKK